MGVSSLSLTPFLFTSSKELARTSGENTIGDGKWYIMWINPESIKFDFKPNASQVYTKKGYEYFHWHNTLPKIEFSGVSGWLFSDLANEDIIGQTSFTRQFFESLQTGNITQEAIVNPVLNNMKSEINSAFTEGIETPRTVIQNSAKLYIQRLQKIALQERFFFDTNRGYEVYNVKKLKIFTKAYQDGRELQGFFTSFHIPENADDVQYVKYSASFTVQSGLEVKELETLNLLKKFRSNSFLGLTEKTVLR